MTVVPLPGKELIAEQRGAAPNPEAVETLRRLLGLAESGHLQAIGFAFLDQHGELELKGVFKTVGDARDVMSGLTILSHTICADISSGWPV